MTILRAIRTILIANKQTTLPLIYMKAIHSCSVSVRLTCILFILTESMNVGVNNVEVHIDTHPSTQPILKIKAQKVLTTIRRYCLYIKDIRTRNLDVNTNDNCDTVLRIRIILKETAMTDGINLEAINKAMNLPCPF